MNIIQSKNNINTDCINHCLMRLTYNIYTVVMPYNSGESVRRLRE